MGAEIANLIQRIPCRHLHSHIATNVRNFHGYVENVALRMVERDPVANCAACGACQVSCKHYRQTNAKEEIPETHPVHRIDASEGIAMPRSSLFTSFSHRPSK